MIRTFLGATRLNSRFLIAAAAAAIAAYGAGLYIEQNAAPAGCCGLTLPNPDPNQAERLLKVGGSQGGAEAQRGTALAVLKARPADVSAWLRLAYADRLQHDTLTEDGRHALDMSYLATPFAGAQSVWRIIFVFDNWSKASPDIRRQSLSELNLAKTKPERERELAEGMSKVRDPAGRLAVLLLDLPAEPGS